MTRIYISGPMTGVPGLNRGAFADAARGLRSEGLEAVNPHEIGDALGIDTSWLGYMREDIKALMDCDAVLALEDWQQSRGARIEVRLAIALGLPVYYSVERAVGALVGEAVR